MYSSCYYSDDKRNIISLFQPTVPIRTAVVTVHALLANATAKQVGKATGATRLTSRCTNVCLAARTTAPTASNPEVASAKATGPEWIAHNQAAPSIVDHTEPASRVSASQYTLNILLSSRFSVLSPLWDPWRSEIRLHVCCFRIQWEKWYMSP